MCLDCVKEHDMHIESKSCKFKFSRNLIIQNGIKTWFGGRLWARAISPQFACLFPHLVSIFSNFPFYGISLRVGMGLHVRESVKEYDMHIELKSCKLKLLRKLVVQ